MIIMNWSSLNSFLKQMKNKLNEQKNKNLHTPCPELERITSTPCCCEVNGWRREGSGQYLGLPPWGGVMETGPTSSFPVRTRNNVCDAEIQHEKLWQAKQLQALSNQQQAHTIICSKYVIHFKFQADFWLKIYIC